MTSHNFLNISTDYFLSAENAGYKYTKKVRLTMCLGNHFGVFIGQNILANWSPLYSTITFMVRWDHRRGGLDLGRVMKNNNNNGSVERPK